VSCSGYIPEQLVFRIGCRLGFHALSGSFFGAAVRSLLCGAGRCWLGDHGGSHGFFLLGLAAAEEGEFLGDNFGSGAALLEFIGPLPVLHGADDRNLAATLEVLVEELGEFAVSLDAVPFRFGLAVTLPVPVILVGGQGKFGGRRSAVEGNSFRIWLRTFITKYFGGWGRKVVWPRPDEECATSAESVGKDNPCFR
jgi:hypothetical protein